MIQAFSLPALASLLCPSVTLSCVTPAYHDLTALLSFQPFTWLSFRSQPSIMMSEMPPTPGPSLCWPELFPLFQSLSEPHTSLSDGRSVPLFT